MVVPDVLKTLCKTLHAGESPKGVLGFAGAPWTLACYLIKHGPYKGFQGVPVFAEIYPDKFSELLEKLTTVTIKYLLAQAESGADALQLFDTWAGMLNVEAYRRHCLPYTARIVEAVQKTGTPVIVYVNGSSHLLEAIEESGCAGISVDWRTCLLDAHRRLKPETVLQGNLDPCVLFSSRDNIIETVTRMLGDGSQHERYIANLGHGILQETPEDNAALIIDTVKAFRKDVTQ
jgi:uroporphyrinogen decarboxylase